MENAFAFSYKVMTLSFHNNEPGFYPGTGDIENVGLGSGKYFSVNVPLAEGITDKQYCNLFDKYVHCILIDFNSLLLQP